jgi:hypothetical protein
VHQQLLGTPVGRARLDWFPARSYRATLVLGHGAVDGPRQRSLRNVRTAVVNSGAANALA